MAIWNLMPQIPKDMCSLAIIVPARLASQRFPRKLLHEIGGKPLILWTAERIRRVAPDIPLHFAVGDEALRECLDGAGFSAVMTDPELPSGSDRIARANEVIGAERIINVQADEPLVTAEQISTLERLISEGEVPMATLACPISDPGIYHNPNRVKVVCDRRGNALYFSRSPIPNWRDGGQGGVPGGAMLHLGLYAYRSEFLSRFVTWEPGTLEALEKLEQLRALENGARIAVGHSGHAGFGIDSFDDIPAFLDQIRLTKSTESAN